ncbi:MAG: hydroxymethylglutaryl-CoA lyase [Actinobacteria bacterium]|nr:hydroxymethylglutaryl-CoA lyase [Actinomycetota bacterium]
MSVRICDVGPRDGLQNHPRGLAAERRAELCRRLAGAGLREVEAVSFVRPDRVPQMAEPERVLAGLDRSEATFSALVLNERGYERAAAAGVEEIHLAVMATEAFSRRNCNASVAESCAAAARIVERAHARGKRVAATVSVAFGCPFEGPVDPDQVLAIAAELLAAGADELMLADTIGYAVPGEVAALVERVAASGATVGVHLHNTRNTGYANALAAIERGATVVEASVGGLGGCPFAPGATGNIASEDLVNLLHREGIATGIDLERLIDTAGWLEAQLEEALPGYVHAVGTTIGAAR